MCMIIVCVVEVQFLINTLGNWLELPPHPLLFSKRGGAFGIQKNHCRFFHGQASLLVCGHMGPKQDKTRTYLTGRLFFGSGQTFFCGTMYFWPAGRAQKAQKASALQLPNRHPFQQLGASCFPCKTFSSLVMDLIKTICRLQMGDTFQHDFSDDEFEGEAEEKVATLTIHCNVAWAWKCSL